MSVLSTLSEEKHSVYFRKIHSVFLGRHKEYHFTVCDLTFQRLIAFGAVLKAVINHEEF